MDALPAVFALRARWVFPVAAPPLLNTCVTIRDSQITAVGPPELRCPVFDLGDVAIIPGLVNAHVHLDLSHFEAPLGTPGMRLPDWIRQVIAARRAPLSPAPDVVARGMQESLLAGTTALGDIATIDWRATVVPDQLVPDAIVFHESIAPTADRVASSLSQAEAFLTESKAPATMRAGLSPHAPYTVRPDLLAALVALSQRYGVPVAMHLAESREELQLIESGAGPFREMLAAVGAWDPSSPARHTSVRAYLEQLARAPRSLVIHGNYLTDGDLAFLAQRAATMSVVYCPRTHDYFQHDPYPLPEMLKRGLNVAVGTDSRASNPDLSILVELKFVAQRYPQLAGSAVLALGTIRGAQALGLADELGTLEPGKLASLAVIRLSEADAADPHAALFSPTARVVQTFVRGRPLLPLTTGSS